MGLGEVDGGVKAEDAGRLLAQLQRQLEGQLRHQQQHQDEQQEQEEEEQEQEEVEEVDALRQRAQRVLQTALAREEEQPVSDAESDPYTSPEEDDEEEEEQEEEEGDDEAVAEHYKQLLGCPSPEAETTDAKEQSPQP